ncbi:MAG: hypothetical protein G01um101418_726 [Parcubacteria group bacterium Gr01-1014_18]|nr:MAG: hypothetical protein Greene041636_716 [Parcubacteria group bacterium Greene0416_36]TSC80218.1 MAG: hypothetical protein G01um101418_726 [Parcubacteria group bacterium Gr01-1014_18]TSC98400.1 MAG: hypothetical protein Greene101420_753 [Parcubacteria group bacterium Greene1014_20]TSD06941.1 MAG: hypothetical protein Greene07142_504 [Parcubacteria group bacterium Greene0714_2]
MSAAQIKNLIDPALLVQFLDLHVGYKIGDFGCGPLSHFVFPISKAIGEGGVIYVMDVQKNVLENIKAMARNMGISNLVAVWTDLEIHGAAPIENNSLDRGMLVNILFQSKKYIDILKECSRMLKIGALLLIVDWKKEDAVIGPPSSLRLEPKKIKEVAKLFNLESVREFDAGPYHYGLVLEKKR